MTKKVIASIILSLLVAFSYVSFTNVSAEAIVNVPEPTDNA